MQYGNAKDSYVCPSYLHMVLTILQRELTEEDILRTLPDKETTLDIMTVTKILSDRGTKSLGDFEVQYVFEPEAKKIVHEYVSNFYIRLFRKVSSVCIFNR